MNEVKFSEDYTVYAQNLKKLIVKVDLLKISGGLNKEKEKIIKKMKDLYNKIFLFQLYKDKNLISVTGFQGAGKTTLVRDYFNIPEGYLPENNSRGEKLPIFIAASLVEKIEAYLYTTKNVEGEIEIHSKKLQDGEIENRSKEPNEQNDLWIEIKVPISTAKIKNPDTHIVLLPGYEKISTDFSQKLLDFVVNVSISSILVMDKNSYARKSTDIILRKINNSFEDLKPIIAITHGDEKPEENEEIKQSVIDTLEVEDIERVIVTGPSEDFSDEWKRDLTKLIENYSGHGEDAFEARKFTMQETLADIDSELEELNEILETVSEDLNINEILNSSSNVGELFKQEYEKYLEKLEKAMITQIVSYKNSKQTEMIDLISKETNFFNNIKTRILGRNLKEEEVLKNKVKDIWENSSQENNSALKVMNKAAIEVLKEYDSIYKLPTTQEDKRFEILNSQKNSLTKIENYFGESIEKESLNNHDLKGLVYLGANFLTSTFNSMESDTNSESIENQVKTSHKYSLNTRDKSIEINLVDTPEIVEATAIEKEVYKNIGSKLMKTIPVVLGVDLVSDGDFDTIENTSKGVDKITTTLNSIGFKVSSKKLLALGGGVAVAATASYAITQNIKDLNKRQIEMHENTQLFIDTLAQSQVYGYIGSLRNNFMNIEEKLRYRHSMLKGRNVIASNIENCQYLLNTVNKQTEKMLERSYDEKLLF